MFRKTLIILSICSVVLLSLVACSNSAASDAPNTVHMSDTTFVKSFITIKKGESIHLVADTYTRTLSPMGPGRAQRPSHPAKLAHPQFRIYRLAVIVRLISDPSIRLAPSIFTAPSTRV
ncbi:hypothetical protein [Ktedonobacter robiniae]|uniref:hypothetical protein n=1 Tax=Ktedonobacter robiniae TaxID=2778365 RepID=UPI001F2B7F69|nr:hypothetical protein [Ktedonobacter robiniae]